MQHRRHGAAIVIRGARQNNLKNLSLELPLNELLVVTGVSGSGKSSLAFSPYARQFLDRMDKPQVKKATALKKPRKCPKPERPRVIGCQSIRPTEPNKGGIMPKQNYLCIQRSQPGKGAKPSPAQMQEMYAKFNAWKEKFKDKIVDMGGQLKAGGKIVTSEGATDGPFVEAKEVIGGFMIVSAESMEEAIEIVRQSPGVWRPESSVEVREISTP